MPASLTKQEKTDVLLQEYNALVGENRRCMQDSTQLLGLTIGIATALVGAGVWQHNREFFLVLPFLGVFVALVSLAKLHEIVLIGAHLATLEQRIADITGEKLLTFFSSTVVKTCDAAVCCDPVCNRRRLAFVKVYGIVGFLLLGLLLVFPLALGLPALDKSGAWLVLYLVGLVVSIGFVLFLGYRVATYKEFYINLIQGRKSGEQAGRRAQQ